MPKTVVVRARVPVATGNQIVEGARRAGMTVSAFLRATLETMRPAEPKPKPAALSGQIGLFQ